MLPSFPLWIDQTWWKRIISRWLTHYKEANACIPATATAKSLQSCPTLYDPIDGSPPGFPVPGILQARTLECVAISFSSAWKWKVKGKSLSRVRLLVTPWTAAYQAPPSMGFSRQKYWRAVPLPSPAFFLLYSYFFNLYFTFWFSAWGLTQSLWTRHVDASCYITTRASSQRW